MTKPGAVLGIAALGVRIEMRRTAGSACPITIPPSMPSPTPSFAARDADWQPFA